MSQPLLSFENVTGGYGTAAIVRGVSGSVAAGEVLCVLGRNGVGKSTFLKLVFGYLRCWQGRIAFDGERIEHLEPSARRRLGIAYSPQERLVFDDLSVRDNLTLTRTDRELDAFAPYFARYPILERRLSQHAGTLSGGEKKILSFVRALSENQALTLFDEPSEGVQWENVLHLESMIAEKRALGSAFIVVEQNLAFAERIADRYLVVDQGRPVLEGSRSSIERSQILAHLRV